MDRIILSYLLTLNGYTEVILDDWIGIDKCNFCLYISLKETNMPSVEKIKSNHKCSRCGKKIHAGEKAIIHRYYDKIDYRHKNLKCRDRS